MYHYAANNPVRYIDPDGRSNWEIYSLNNRNDNESKNPGLPYFIVAGFLIVGEGALIWFTGGAAAVMLPETLEAATLFIVAGSTVNAVDAYNNYKKHKSVGIRLRASASFASPSPMLANGKNNDDDNDEENGDSLSDLERNPPNHGDYEPPKNWDGKKVKNPNGPGSGYPAKNGDVWVPTDHKGTHKPHWDVEHPNGKHTNVYPE